MKVIGAIIRWMFGLLFAAILFISVCVIVPISVIGQQVLQRETATRWVDAVTKDETFMSEFVTGIFQGISESEDISDPNLKAFFIQIADPTTSAGQVARKVFDNKTMGENIRTNASYFYDWLEGKSQHFVLKFIVGGTLADQKSFLGSYMTAAYSGLPTCTKADLLEMAQNPPASPLEATCKSGEISTAQMDQYVTQLLNDVDARKILRDGITFDTQLTASHRDSLLVLQQIAQAGLALVWVVVAICVIFMIVLFTPRGVNFLMTGVVVGLTGLTLMSAGGGMLALVSTRLGSTGAETIVQAFSGTLGKPIATQGMYFLVLAVILVVIGIIMLSKKKRPEQEEVDEVPERVVEAEPAIMATAKQEEKKEEKPQKPVLAKDSENRKSP